MAPTTTTASLKGNALTAEKSFLTHFIETLGVVTLMLVTPAFVLSLWYTCYHLDGSYAKLVDFIVQDKLEAFRQMIQTPDELTWKILGLYFLGQFVIMAVVPGKKFEGPLSPMGNRPVYKAHGLQCYFLNLALYAILYTQGVFTGTMIYEQMGKIYTALVIVAFVLCFFLWIKGHVAPTDNDSGSSGNPIMDFYWGMELYPRIFGFDIKHYISCRVSMTAWPLLLISYAMAEYERDHGFSSGMIVCVVTQLIYLTKFFLWETGYLCTLDIIHDRFGYYICWGFLCFVPSMYTSSGLFLVNHTYNIPPWQTAVLVAFGVYCTYLNWSVDNEKTIFRESHGTVNIWGKKPTFIEATYVAPNGKTAKSLLLTAGWWGMSRHINYTFELLATYAWAPLLQFDYALPYSYSFFLTALLLHRVVRDEERCHLKYGKPYAEYCKKVPYRIIPGVI